MLLLLEGRPLANDDLFDQVLLETIGFYFRDFAKHREEFRPYALINDILRYWRTLCLNYEHGRAAKRSELHRRLASIEADVSLDKDAKQARSEETYDDFRVAATLDNLKLRYSRLALCFSMISLWLATQPALPPSAWRKCAARFPPSAGRWPRSATRPVRPPSWCPGSWPLMRYF